MLDIATMDDVVEESLGQRPLAMLLLAAFAAARAGAGVGRHLQRAGLYGAAARARDRHPHGARRAVGGRACGWSWSKGLKPTLIGVALGLVLAAALVRVMATLLFGVSQHDPGTFSAVAAIMLAVGIVATLVPAYRATRVDPIVTLRSE